jgi:hypothetical protein
MQVSSTEINEILSLLAEMPRRLVSMTQGLENARLYSKAEEESWSVNDILAHLRACADVWGKSILAMISQDHPTIRYVSPRTWLRKTDYPAQEFYGSLHAFTEQRNDLLKSLTSLANEDWVREATFTGTTRGREQTIFSYARRIVDHEAQHLDQIERILLS